MLVLLLTVALSATNEFVLAYSDDGASALTLSRESHEGGGAAIALRFIGHDKSKRYEVSNSDAKKDRVTLAECKTRVEALAKAVKEARFTGVEVSAKGCGKKERDTIVRTLKRHSEEGQDAQFKLKDGVLLHPKFGKATFENNAISLDGVSTIMLSEEIKAESMRIAVSPSKKLILVFHGPASSGASVVYAAALAADGKVTPIGLE